LCALKQFLAECLIAEILEENCNDTTLPVNIVLFQGLPKGDKMELIIQKAVELGVSEIVPTEMKNCVVKIEEKKKQQKRQRWQAISEAAAKQSKCNFVPEVSEIFSFESVLKRVDDIDLFLVPYENEEGILSTKKCLEKIKKGMSVGILIGPEGGFSESEIEKLKKAGAKTVSLGKRILRTETAAITAVSMCMLYTEMMVEND
jgi:16S rRNA (uracil1498-N3)-methyltransferase